MTQIRHPKEKEPEITSCAQGHEVTVMTIASVMCFFIGEP